MRGAVAVTATLLAIGAAATGTAASHAGTAAPGDPATPIVEQGATRVIGPASGSSTIEAMILTRRAPTAEARAYRATRCSGGRITCSLVDRLMLTVGGRRVEVPPHVLLPLADLNEARLLQLGADRYELVLTGGDAAPAYQARLFFDGRRVTRMDLWSDEAGMVEQRTTFNDLSRAFR